MHKLWNLSCFRAQTVSCHQAYGYRAIGRSDFPPAQD